MLFQALVFALFALVATAIPFNGGDYMFMVDAGSGGTRWSLFDSAGAVKYIGAKQLGEDQYKTANNEENALGGYAGSLTDYWTKTKKMLTDEMPALLMDKGFTGASGNMIQKDELLAQLRSTPIHIRATAGMRQNAANAQKFRDLVAAAQQDTITVQDENGVDVDVPFIIDAKIIPGSVEGLYGFLANKAAMTPLDTIYFEQGGASAQISFMCPKVQCSDVAYKPQFRRRRLLAMKHGVTQQSTLSQEKTGGYVDDDRNECFFSESFMGYGKDEAAAILLLSGVPNANACMNTGLTVTQTGGVFTATPAMPEAAFLRELTDYHAVSGKNLPGPEVSGKREIVGAPNIAQCVAAITAFTANSKEFRGFIKNTADPTADPVPELVNFVDRWTRIQTALTACNKHPPPGSPVDADNFVKTHIFMNTPACHTKPARGLWSGGLLGWPVDAGATGSDKFIFQTVGKYDAFAPMTIAMLQYIYDKVNGFIPTYDLRAQVPNNAEDWAPAGALFEGQGKSFAFTDAGPTGDAGEFAFFTNVDGNYQGPAAEINKREPEMHRIKVV